MTNPQLQELNFKRLLSYPNGPTVVNRTEVPTRCDGFCVSCERKGHLSGSAHQLDQMSHGADTSDFETLLSPLATTTNAPRVMFLLESPGGYYDLGVVMTHEGVTKRPPVKHYYWTPEIAHWPTNGDDVGGSYGPYFAYLIHHHGLRQAYFTNIVKCSLADKDAEQFIPYQPRANPSLRDTKIIRNCFSEFLKSELQLFDPQLVFYFGQKAALMGYHLELPSVVPEAKFQTLYHPASRRSGSTIARHNDRIIHEALTSIDLA
jgi:hypothetical protein